MASPLLQCLLLPLVLSLAAPGGPCTGDDCAASDGEDEASLLHLRPNLKKAAAGPVMKLHVLDKARFPDALCLDGSPGGFYFYGAQSGEHSNSWLVYLEGGGWCTSPDACAQRVEWGGSGSWGPEVPAGPEGWAMQGLNSIDCSQSPEFCNFNHVYVKYCDATSYTSHLDAPYPGGIYFRGRNILDAIIQTLVDDFGMASAEQFLFTGCSAGGLGVILNADHVHGMLAAKAPSLKKFGAVPCSGFFQHHPTVQGVASYETNMAQAFNFANWTVDSQECLDDFGPEEAWKCAVAANAYNYIKAPIFIVNSALDAWQTNYILTRRFLSGAGPSGECPVPGWWECGHNVTACSEEQLVHMNGYMDSFHKSMHQAHSSFGKQGNGAFISTCQWHCEADSNQDQGQPWQNFEIGGKIMKDAVADWWTSGFQDWAHEHTHIDNGVYTVGKSPNPTCTVFNDVFSKLPEGCSP